MIIKLWGWSQVGGIGKLLELLGVLRPFDYQAIRVIFKHLGGSSLREEVLVSYGSALGNSFYELFSAFALYSGATSGVDSSHAHENTCTFAPVLLSISDLHHTFGLGPTHSLHRIHHI